jgi:hypothetical protein
MAGEHLSYAIGLHGLLHLARRPGRPACVRNREDEEERESTSNEDPPDKWFRGLS